MGWWPESLRPAGHLHGLAICRERSVQERPGAAFPAWRCRAGHGPRLHSTCQPALEGVRMPALLIARFRGDVGQLTRAYDRAHKTIMEAGGAPGELRHHCAVGDDSLYLVGVWESEEL